MTRRSFILTAVLAIVSACNSPKDGTYRLEVLSTNDIHGSWFDSTYTGGRIKNSIFAVNYYVDSVRTASGAENVVLIDAGDCLQGDNGAYYFNYVDTLSPHLFPRLVSYMGYDAVVVGNHDIETGHSVYDRVAGELEAAGIPFMAGNAIRNDNGRPYFPEYKIVKRAGLKVAILGFTNPNMKAWLTESLWSGMSFESLLPLVQQEVDKIVAREKPQVVIAAVHSGTGSGDGSTLESQGLDLYKSLSGVDFLICSHDHAPRIEQSDSICLINSGSHARNVGHGVIEVTVEGGKLQSKSLSAELIPVKAEKADPEMRAAFRADYEAVKAFTLKEVGELKTDMHTRDSYRGMCDYINLIHTVCLKATGAQVSFAAPLTYNGTVKAGTLLYNDLFTIYPYENQLFVINMTGREIKDYLEYSYDQWINTLTPGGHILRIRQRDDARNSQRGWSFIARPYNFDSAAGLDYTVDVTKAYGERVNILGMATGEAFEEGATYSVAMTSYRASGGGDLLHEGAGVDTDKIDGRITGRYPEIRNLLYEYLMENAAIEPAVIGNPALIGHWSFVPEEVASKALDADMVLLFK